MQCSTPRTAPPMGKGVGRMASVRRRSLASTPGTLALSRYCPVSGFISMSPAQPKNMLGSALMDHPVAQSMLTTLTVSILTSYIHVACPAPMLNSALLDQLTQHCLTTQLCNQC